MNIKQILELNNIESTEENILKYSSLLDENKILLIDSSNIILEENIDPDYFYMQLLNNNNLELSENNLSVLKEALNNHSILLFEGDDEKDIALEKSRKYKNIGKRIAGTIAGAALGGAALGGAATAIGGKIEGDAKYASDLKGYDENIRQADAAKTSAETQSTNKQNEITAAENSKYERKSYKGTEFDPTAKDYNQLSSVKDINARISELDPEISKAEQAVEELEKGDKDGKIDAKELSDAKKTLSDLKEKKRNLESRREEYKKEAIEADKAEHKNKEDALKAQHDATETRNEENFNKTKTDTIGRLKKEKEDIDKTITGENGYNKTIETNMANKNKRVAEGKNMYIGKSTKIAAGVSAGVGTIGGGIAGNLLAKKSNKSEDDAEDKRISKDKDYKENINTIKNKHNQEIEKLEADVNDAKKDAEKANTELNYEKKTNDLKVELGVAKKKTYKVTKKDGTVVKTGLPKKEAEEYVKSQSDPKEYSLIMENYIVDILNINNPNSISFNENINEDYFFMQLLDTNGFKVNKNNLNVFKEAWYNGNVLFKNNEQYIIDNGEKKEGIYMYTNQIKQILDENGFLPTDDNVDILMDELIENQTLILYDDDIMLEEDSDPDYFFMQLLDKNGYKVNKNNMIIIKESFNNGRILLTESPTLTQEEQDEAINSAKAKKQAEEDKKAGYIEKGEKKDARSSKTKDILKTLGAIGLGTIAGGSLAAGGVGAAEGIGTLANSDIATKIANNRELMYGGATTAGAAAGALGAGAAELIRKPKTKKSKKDKK